MEAAQGEEKEVDAGAVAVVGAVEPAATAAEAEEEEVE